MMTAIIYRSRNPEQESGPSFSPAHGAILNVLSVVSPAANVIVGSRRWANTPFNRFTLLKISSDSVIGKYRARMYDSHFFFTPPFHSVSSV
jgi:hypothetical protein